MPRCCSSVQRPAGVKTGAAGPGVNARADADAPHKEPEIHINVEIEYDDGDKEQTIAKEVAEATALYAWEQLLRHEGQELLHTQKDG